MKQVPASPETPAEQPVVLVVDDEPDLLEP